MIRLNSAVTPYLAVLLAAFSSTACAGFGTGSAHIAPVTDPWTEMFDSGSEAWTRGDTARALAFWEQAVAADSTRPDAFLNLGIAYTGKGDLTRGLEMFRKVISRSQASGPSPEQLSSSFEARQNAIAGVQNIGSKYFNIADYARAADVFRLLTELESRSSDAWYNYSVALYKQNKFKELIPVAERLVEIDPQNRNANIILLTAYMKVGEEGKALQLSDRIDNLSPEAPDMARSGGEDVEAEIKVHCAEEWPSDFSMRAYCEERQAEAVVELGTLLQTRGGMPIPDFNTVTNTCVAEWEGDYTMIVYCLKRQIEGYNEVTSP